MNTIDIQEEKLSMEPSLPPQRLPMDSLKNARRSLARIIAAYYRGAIDERKFKMMVYGMNVLLGYLKEVETEELEQRIAELEKRMSISKERTYA
jgi:hypothetical protein